MNNHIGNQLSSNACVGGNEEVQRRRTPFMEYSLARLRYFWKQFYEMPTVIAAHISI